jgi:hypothetical protein
VLRVTPKPYRTATKPVVETVNEDEDQLPAQQEAELDMVPTTLTVAKKVNGRDGRYFFKSLFDSGGTSVMINRKALPKDCEVFVEGSRNFTTTQGTFASPGFVYLTDLALPEFTAVDSEDQEDQSLCL